MRRVTHSTNSFWVSSSLFFLNCAGVMLCPMIVHGAGTFGGGGGTFSLRALPTTAMEVLGRLSLLAGVMGGLQGWAVLSSSSAYTTERTT